MVMKLKEVGRVKSDDRGFYIELRDEFVKGMKEMDGFSHIQVIWWADKFQDDDYRTLVISESPYKNSPKEIGIFATRSPVRPNPIMMTVTGFLGMEDNKIRVAYLDADMETPVLDIKPYHPCTDKVRDVSVPEWCRNWPSCIEESATFDWESVFENAM